MFHRIKRCISALIIIAVSFSANSEQMDASTATPTDEEMARACPIPTSPCLIDFFKKTTQELCLDAIKVVDPKYWEESRKKQPIPRFAFIKKQSNYMPIHQILFMQDSASEIFSDHEHDVIDLAKKLKSGEIKLSSLPTVEVWQDKEGRVWTINHRRIIAMILAGIEQVPVKWADEATVLQNNYEFTTTNGGKEITMRLTDNIGMLIKNDGTCNANMMQKFEYSGWLRILTR